MLVTREGRVWYYNYQRFISDIGRGYIAFSQENCKFGGGEGVTPPPQCLFLCNQSLSIG